MRRLQMIWFYTKLLMIFACLFMVPAHGAESIFFQNHLHSHAKHQFSRHPHQTGFEKSYSQKGIKHLIALAKSKGVEAIAITDHNSISPWFDSVFINETDVLMVPAMEWTNRYGGHATLMGFEALSETQAIMPDNPRASVTKKHYQAMIDETHQRGGLVVVNHPSLFYLPQRWPSDLYGADGVELNFHFWMRPQATIDWWHEKLKLGKKVFLVGGSDYHVGGKFTPDFETTNRVTIEKRSASAVMTALKNGKNLVLRNTKSPLVDFYGYLINGERFEMGDQVELGPLQSLLIQVKVTRSKGHTIDMYSRKGLVSSKKIKKNKGVIFMTYRTSFQNDFIRFEIKEGGRLETVSNALYLYKR